MHRTQTWGNGINIDCTGQRLSKSSQYKTNTWFPFKISNVNQSRQAAPKMALIVEKNL